jgi:drug/metabolite transporter (DMT)-like permease
MDLLASTLEYMSLNYISGSAWSISSSVVILSTCVCSRVMLGTAFKAHQLLACLLAVIGVAILGLGESLGNDGNYGQVGDG